MGLSWGHLARLANRGWGPKGQCPEEYVQIEGSLSYRYPGPGAHSIMSDGVSCPPDLSASASAGRSPCCLE